MAAVACVLLIASANVTILLSVRTAARQRELAMRHALGASRGQLVRLVMLESVTLALFGGAVGLVLAHWGTGLMGLRFAELIPRNDGLGFDAGVLVVAVLVSVTVGRRTTGWDPADPEAEWQTIVGVFSVVSYSVGRRVREVAVRMALGGTPRRVVALVMRQGLVPVATGLVLGAATALVFLRVLTNRLFGIAAHDPLTFTGAAFLVFGIAALAAWLPARRASRVEPMTVLRSE